MNTVFDPSKLQALPWHHELGSAIGLKIKKIKGVEGPCLAGFDYATKVAAVLEVNADGDVDVRFHLAPPGEVAKAYQDGQPERLITVAVETILVPDPQAASKISQKLRRLLDGDFS